MAKRKDCYTDEEKDEIISHVLVNLACGRFVHRIFMEDEATEQGVKLPTERSFWYWVFDAGEQSELFQKLMRARQAGIEAKLDQAMVIAETPMIGQTETDKMNAAGDEYTEVKREDMLGHRKLLIETTFKAAQMMKPKTYGPKLDLTSGGEQLGVTDALEAARRRAEKALDKKDGE